MAASSIDPSYLAEQYTAIERAAKDASLSAKYSLYSSQISAFNSLKTSLTDFVDSLDDILGDTGVLANQATVSDSDVLSATANSDAVSGSYEIFVDQIAQAHQVALSFDPDATLATDGEFSISLGGDEFTIDMSTLPAGATISDLASAINSSADNTGVSATLMRSGTETYLVLTSEETGAANDISLNFTAGADPAGADITSAIAAQQELTAAQDAIVRIGSSSTVSITSASNQLEDVIEGVTINLTSAQQAGDSSIKIEVGQDLEQTESNIQDFVDQFNGLMDKLTSDSLSSDSMSKSLVRQLRSAFQGMFEGKTLYSVGIEFDRSGNLKIDSDRLQEALEADGQTLSDMLSGDNGLFATLQTSLEPYSKSYGLITKKTQSLQASLDLVIDKQERHEYKMEQVYSRYLSQFTQMQITISQLESSMGSF